MVEIAYQVYKPLIEKLFTGYRELAAQLETHPCSKAEELKPIVQKSISRLEKILLDSVDHECLADKNFPEDFRLSIRKAKLDLHVQQRRWLRFVRTGERMLQAQRKPRYPSEIAA